MSGQDRPVRALLLGFIGPALLIAALSAGIFHQAGLLTPGRPADVAEIPQTVVIPARSFTYRSDGEFLRGSRPVDAPMKTVTSARKLTITKYQVTAREYEACVLDGGCTPAETPVIGPDVPATGVNFDDATAYARWLSRRTGDVWSVPTDAQIAQAAGGRFPDDATGLDPDSRNPALRWLADYERETRAKAGRDPAPQPLGTFGENEYGLADFGGNVWEWTSTCHRRVHLFRNGSIDRFEPACGVYVTVAAHRSPISAFIRDPRGGGCSVATPPDNLGFRLVKSTSWYAPILRRMRRGAEPG